MNKESRLKRGNQICDDRGRQAYLEWNHPASGTSTLELRCLRSTYRIDILIHLAGVVADQMAANESSCPCDKNAHELGPTTLGTQE